MQVEENKSKLEPYQYRQEATCFGRPWSIYFMDEKETTVSVLCLLYRDLPKKQQLQQKNTTPNLHQLP